MPPELVSLIKEGDVMSNLTNIPLYTNEYASHVIEFSLPLTISSPKLETAAPLGERVMQR